ncbi:MAG: PepSY domain-containing protein [Pseudomonadales bacterium]|jgi:uncharacterized iron-regulated membrane protein|nr:PepSY domain-containing protein [Pseudomonadales bacterium]
MLRKTLFWLHLCCGIAVGLVVFTMAFTGAALMYERQVQQWAARQDYLPVQAQTTRLPLETLIALQHGQYPEMPVTALTITNDPGAPVEFRAGRRSVSLNPYDGTPMTVGSPALSAFFSTMTGVHRWLNLEGEHRALARQITGVSNVTFLFLVLSGLYLWLPKLWKWALLKVRLCLRGAYPSSKARDFHWHHIAGIWMALPLLAVIASGAVISYPWAANLMYWVFGAEIPQQAIGGSGSGTGEQRAAHFDGNGVAIAGMPLDTLLQNALAHSGAGWNRVNLSLPQPGATVVRIEIDKGNGAQAQRRHTLVLARESGAVIQVNGYADTPKAQRLRSIARFLHTGEVLGFWGQTLAGVASFAAVLLVWTGLALSWRRLISAWRSG